MALQDKNIATNSGEYWKKIDELYAIEERKNIIAAIRQTDNEKFYAFTRMIRVTNTLNKVKVLSK